MAGLRNILLVLPNVIGKAGSDRFARLCLLSRIEAFRFPLKAYNFPLDLATIAALTPDGIEVDIWDETVQGQILESTILPKAYDLVGIGGYLSTLQEAKRLSQMFRRLGIITTVGGAGVSLFPEAYRGHFDVLFFGEAEYTWPRFIEDFSNQRYQNEYRQVGTVDLQDTPIPKWSNLTSLAKHYLFGPVQTNRGCPFNCEFCATSELYGRRVRHKPTEQILDEITALQQIGFRTVFFADDNFYSSPTHARELVRQLVSLNNSFPEPLTFVTELSLNIAKDDEILALLSDANFSSVCIGIESPNEASLKEANKLQNVGTDIPAAVRKIHSYGLIIRGAMMAGFDNDDQTIFQRTFDFLQEAGIPNSQINILRALPGTRLWHRLRQEKRLFKPFPLSEPDQLGFAAYESNVIPMQMTVSELETGHRDLLRKLHDWHNFEIRMKKMIRQVRRKQIPFSQKPYGFLERVLFRGFTLFFMNHKARKTTWRLINFTKQNASQMLRRVMSQLFHQWLMTLESLGEKKTTNKQISVDSSRALQLLQETVLSVPNAFRQPYKNLFPSLRQRVSEGLFEKTDTDNVLVNIIYEFLVKCAPALESFKIEHRESLFEICDRQIEDANRKRQRALVPQPTQTTIELCPSKPVSHQSDNSLADDVIRWVERELRSRQLDTTVDYG